MHAGPTGGEIAGGVGAISTPDAVTTVVSQQSQNLAINWQSFNLGSTESVRFVQPSSAAIVLNRVTGGDVSSIFGRIDATGTVFIVNPRGVVFGETANINVGSLLASGLDMNVSDFMAGRYNLAANGTPGMVVNHGILSAASGGSIAMVGGEVVNTGLISAHYGRVTLAGAEKAFLDFDGDGLMKVEITGELKQNLDDASEAVRNSGTIDATGGEVVLAAAATKGLFDNLVNNEGIVIASAIDTTGGVVRLIADGGNVVNSGIITVASTAAPAGEIHLEANRGNVINTGTLEATSVKAAGGAIELVSNADTLIMGGQVDAGSAEAKGGTIQVLGDRVMVSGPSRLGSAGGAGGGVILIGGDLQGRNPLVRNAKQTVIGPDAIIDASALHSGSGGRIIIWSDEFTKFFGTVSARGPPTGHGGFIEVSGHHLVFAGVADLTAAPGQTGTLLLDPTDITISNGAGTAEQSGTNPVTFSDATSDGPSPSVVNNTTLATQLATANVIITTSSLRSDTGNITVSNSVTWATATTLTLQADGAITVNAAITNSTLAGGIVLQAGGNITLGAAVSTPGNLTLNSGGAVTQTQALTAAGLELLGTGTFTLTNGSNNVGKLAGNVTGSGSLSYRDTDGFAIDTVNSTNKLSAAGNITLQGGGSVTQVVPLTATGLELKGAGYTLTNSSNDVATLAINTGSAVSYRDATGITIGTVNTVGITTSNDNVTLQTGTTLAIDDDVDVGTGNLSLTVGGAVTQNAGDTVVAAGLELKGSGPFTLTDAANDIDTLAANVSEAISYRDVGSFAVGTVNTVGITTSNDSVTLQSGNNLTTTNTISTGSGAVTLTATGNIVGANATSDISATGLISLTGATVGTSGNDIHISGANLAVVATGSVRIVNSLAYANLSLTVDPSTANPVTYSLTGSTTGITLVDGGSALNVTAIENDGTTLNLTLANTGGNIDLADGAISNIGAGNVTLTASGSITDDTSGDTVANITTTGNVTLTAGAAIAGGTSADLDLAVTGGGTVTATASGGAIDILGLTSLKFGAVSATTDVQLISNDGLTVAGITAGAGGGDTIVVRVDADNNSASTLTLTGAFSAGGSITIDGTGTDDTLAGRDIANSWVISGTNAGTLNSQAFTDFASLTGGTSTDSFTFTSGTLAGSVNGGLGTDTLTGPNATTSWTITGANSGSITSVAGFTGIENLVGGTGADTFAIQTGGSISGTIDGGAGTDSVDYSSQTGPVTINLGGSLAGVTNIEGLTGGDSGATFGFTLVGLDETATWHVTGANDGTYTSTTITSPITFTNFGNLTGGSGADSFVFDNNTAALTGAIDGNNGADTLNWAARSSAVSVALTGLGASSDFNGTEATIGGGFSDINAVTGGSGSNTLTGLNAGAAWHITSADDGTYVSTNTLTFTDFGNLSGGSGADQFTIDNAVTVSGVVDGKGGSDSLVLTAYNTANAVTLSAAGSNGFDGDVGSIVGSFAGIDTINGGTATNSLTGLGGNANWSITDVNDGTYTDVSSGKVLAFTDLANLTGGAGNDAFTLSANGTIGVVNGGSGSNTLTARDVANTWTISGNDAGAVTNVTSFSNVGNLNGGSSTDQFDVGDTFTLSGVVDGKGGADTLNLAAYTAATSVTLAAAGVNGFDGDAGAIVGSFAGIDTINGGTATNSLSGVAGDTNWAITAPNAGSLTDVGSGKVLVFTSYANLTGGAGADSFTLSGTGTIGVLDGAGGSNSLTARDTANTWTITANNAGTVTNVSSFSNIGTLNGGSSTDLFIFNDGFSASGIVDGKGGTDTLDLSAYTTATDAVLSGASGNGFAGDVGTVVGSFAGIDAIDGGTAANSLTGMNGNAAWAVTSPNTGSYTDVASTQVLTFTNFASLAGGTGDDAFALSGTGAIGSIIGGSGTDTLAARDVVNAWTINSAGGGSVDNVTSFAGIENLTGGSNADTFSFTSSGSISGVIDGGAGNDSVSYASQTGPVTVALGNFGGGLVSIESLVGSMSGGDTLIGSDTVNAWVINGSNSGSFNATLGFSSFENLTGGSAADTFTFANDSGVVTGAINGGGGSDTLDVAGYSTATGVVLSGVTASGFSGSNPAVQGGFSGIDAIVGSSSTPSQLTGLALNATWTISTPDSGSYVVTGGTLTFTDFANLAGNTGSDAFILTGTGTIASVAGAAGAGVDSLTARDTANTWTITSAGTGAVTNVTSFSGIEDLNGGSGTDAFIFSDGASVSGTVDGNGGADTLDLGFYTTVTDVTLTGGVASGFAGDAGSVVGDFADIDGLVGGSQVNTLTGYGAVATWTTTGANDGSYTAATFTLAYTDFANLTGGGLADTFNIGHAVGDALGGLGDDSFKVTADVAIGLLDGEGGSDTLTGPDIDSKWSIESANGGSLDVNDDAAQLVAFDGMENLTGGTGADTFEFGPAGDISGLINGGAGSDSVSYAGLAGPIVVTVATFGSGLANIENVIGTGNAGDEIVGPNSASIWHITGTDTGSIGSLSFDGFENLTGGTAADTFVFDDDSAAISGTVDGGGGGDRVDLSALTPDLDLTLSALGSLEGFAFTTTPAQFDNISAIDLPAGAYNTLTGLDAVATWDPSAARAGTYTSGGETLTYTGVDELHGGSDVDTFNLGVSIPGGVYGGSGDDVFNLQGDFSFGALDGEGGVDTLAAPNSDNYWKLTGADAGSIDVGDDSANLHPYMSMENLLGNTGDDYFYFFDDSASVSGSINGGMGAGYDSVDYGGQTGPINVVLATLGSGVANIEALYGSSSTDDSLTGEDISNSWVINGPDYGNVNGTLDFYGFENVVGGGLDDTFAFNDQFTGSISGGAGDDRFNLSFGYGASTLVGGTGTDTLVGIDDTNTWNITGAGSGTLSYNGGAVVQSFGEMENLVGGDFDDTFIFGASGTLAGLINGQGQVTKDTVDYSARASVSVTIGSPSLGAINIEQFKGNNTNSTLAGLNATATWLITGQNDGTYTSGATTVSFIDFSALTGGTGDDSFVFQSNASSVTGALSGGSAGIDTLNYAGTTTGITINLSGGTATRTGGISNLDGVIGSSSAGDQIYAENNANLWHVTSANAGDVDGFTFSSVEYLIGSGNTDRFIFSDGATVSGYVWSQGGNDTLDFSAYTTGRTVSLVATFGAFSFQGSTAAIAGNFYEFETVIGSSTAANSFTGLSQVSAWNVSNANAGSYTTGTNSIAFQNFGTINGGTSADNFSIGALGSITGAINGGGGTDSLTGRNAANTWNITAADGGSVTNVASYTSVENLTGGSGADTFAFNGGSVTGLVDGGSAGTDILNYSALAGPVTVNLQTPSANLVGSFTRIDGVVGSASAADALVGANTVNAWSITTADAGSVNGFSFSSVENLSGGSLADTFAFANLATVTGVVDGNGGADSLSFAAYGSGVSVTLSGLASSGFDGDAGALVGTFSDIDAVTGATGQSNSLGGLNSASAWSVTGADDGSYTESASSTVLGFTDFNTLLGGTANDAFTIVGSGVITGTINGGGTGTDTLQGPDAASLWNLTGSGAGNIAATVSSFSGIENLVGGSGDDTFAFASTSGVVTGTLSGGSGGTDVLNYSALATGVAVDLGNSTASQVTGGFGNIDGMVGGSGSDTLTGANIASTWTISAANAGDVSGGPTFTFNGVENLTGGSSTDSFVFSNGASVTGTLTGNGGADTLDLSAYLTPTPVTLSAAGSGNGYSGDAGAITGSFASIDSITGATGLANSLGGLNANAAWLISGVDAGSYTDTASGFALAFANFRDLDGGSGNDAFTIGPAGSLSGTLAGGTGTDTLTGRNSISTWHITGSNAGDITGYLTSFTGIENLSGGTLADSFIFSNLATISGVVDGNGGADSIDLSAYTTATPVTLSGTAAGGGFAGDAGAITGTFADIDAVTGAAGQSNSLGGLSVASVWTITGADDGTYTAVAAALTLGFTDFNTLAGGTATDSFAITTGSITGSIAGGGAATDTLQAANAANTWNITGAGAGNIAGASPVAAYSGIENVVGGTANDSFVFASTGGTVTGTLNGGAGGTDTLNYSAIGSPIAVNLGVSTASQVTGTFANIDGVVGGSGSDTLTGANGTNVWSIATTDAGSVGGFTFSAIENLTGGTGADEFAFADAATLSGFADGGAGIDKLNLSAYSTATPVTLGGATANGYTGDAGVITGGFTGIDAIDFSATGTNGLTGLAGNANWAITGANSGTYTDVSTSQVLAFTNVANLTGNSGNDWFMFQGGTIGNIAGGTGTDRLDYSALAGPVTVNLQSSTANQIGGTFAGIEQLVGSAGSDTLIGANAVNTWNVTATNAGTVGTLAFSSVENLTGGTGLDSFVFADAATVSGIVDGAAGADVFNLSAYTTATNVSLASLGATDGFNGSSGAASGGIRNIDDIRGSSSGASTLTGLNAAANWVISGTNAGTYTDVTSSRALAFTNFPSLAGGSGNDAFAFSGTGTLGGNLAGGSGTDTLDYSALAGPITVNLQTSAASLITGTFSGIDNLVGSSGVDTLTGADTANSWSVTGNDAGSVNALTFSSIENLTGGALADTFTFADGKSVSGTVDGKGGADALVLTAYTSATNVALTGLGTIDGFKGTVAGTGGFDDIDSVTASGTVASTLTGRNAIAAWAITNNDSGTYTDTGSGNVLAFNGFANLSGGSAADTFTFSSGKTVSGIVDGNGGSDSLNLASYSTATNVLLTGLGATDGFNGSTAAATFQDIDSVTGSSTAASTLTGRNVQATWALAGANAGTYTDFASGNVLSFGNFTSLTGGSGADTFNFAAGATLGGVVDGAGGTDVLNLASYTTATNVLLTALGGTDGFAGTSPASAFQNINVVNGSSTVASTLTGRGAVATWSVTATNAGTYADTGSGNTLAFTNFPNLSGGSAADTFAFDAGITVAGIVDGNGGTDVLDLSAYTTTTNVTLTSTGALDGFNGTTNAVTGGFQEIDSVKGGTQLNTLTGVGLAATWTLTASNAGSYSVPASSRSIAFSGFGNLTGGAADDTFSFATPTAAVTGQIDGGAQTLRDTVDYSAQAGPVSVTLGSLSGIVNVERLVGTGSAADTLTGADIANAWSITGLDSGTVNATLDYSGFENLTGGSLSDSFTLAGGSVTGVINGGGGSDTLTGANVVNAWLINAANGGDVTGIGSFSNIENLTGGSATDTFTVSGGTLSGTLAGGGGTDTLVGDNVANTWTITSANGGTVTGVNAFNGIENLTGGTGADGFIIAGGSITGTVDGATGSDSLTADNVPNTWTISGSNSGNVTGVAIYQSIEALVGGSSSDEFVFAGGTAGTINGGGSTDRLNYSGLPGPVSINLQTASGTGITGSFTSIESILGSASKSDVLTGANASNAWTVTSSDIGTVGSLAFASFENLTGGGLDDTFTLNAGVTGTIDGAAGSDSIVVASPVAMPDLDMTLRAETISDIGAVTIFGAPGAILTLDATGGDIGSLVNPLGTQVSALVVTSSAGDAFIAESDALDLAGINLAAGDFWLSTAGAITDSAAIYVAGSTTLAAGATNDIVLDAGDDFVGALSVTSANDVTITDINGIDLAGVTTADFGFDTGDLTVTAQAGDITDSGNIAVAGNANFTATGNDITLGEGGETTNFGTLTFAAANVEIHEDSLMTLAGASTASTALLQGVGINGAAGSLVVSTASLIAGAGNIVLTGANDFITSVTVASAGAATLNDINTLDLAGVSTTAGLTVTATGITDSGNLSVGGNANFTAAGGAITLGEAGGETTNFGSLTLNAATASVSEDSAMDLLGASSVTTLSLTAAGNIDDGASATLNATTLTLAAGANDIVLDNANGFGTVIISNARHATLADVNDITLGAIALSGNLDVSASNIAGTSAIIVPGTTTFDVGPAGAIALTNVGNDFSGVVTVTSAGTLTLVDADTLSVVSNVPGAIALTTTVGDISLTEANLVNLSRLNIDAATGSGALFSLVAPGIVVDSAFGNSLDDLDLFSTATIVSMGGKLAASRLTIHAETGDSLKNAIGTPRDPIVITLSDSSQLDATVNMLVEIYGWIRADNFDAAAFQDVFTRSSGRVFIIGRFDEIISGVQGSFINAPSFSVDSSQFRTDLNIFGVDGAGVLLPADQCEDEESPDCAR